MQPFFKFAFIFATVTTFFVLPMSSKSLFGNIVHTLTTNLYFYPFTVIAHQGDVQCLIAICLRMTHPIAESIRMRFVYLRDSDINIEAIVQLFLLAIRLEYDSYSQYIIYFLEWYVLILHFIPYRINRFHPCNNMVFKSHFIELGSYRRSKFLKDFITFGSRSTQFLFQFGIFFGRLIFKTQIL